VFAFRKKSAMHNNTILIVDDEKNIRNLLRMYLEQGGFTVEEAIDGPATLKYLELGLSPQLIILDVMLPGIDGFEVCNRIRGSKYADIPILMLTARDDDVDKIVGLEIGADDYVTKPFNPREVVARVKAILRRSQGIPDSVDEEIVRIGDLVIDQKRRTVTIQNQPIPFRRKEFDLLYVLAKEKDIVHSREQLLEQVWGYDYYGQTRTVDVHVAAIRNKLTTDNVQIETVTGIGYRLTTLS
jgi:two-component system alkaline phosphatase synthesis response regulator PhoP